MIAGEKARGSRERRRRRGSWVVEEVVGDWRTGLFPRSVDPTAVGVIRRKETTEP